jgi:hypothetical protein
MFNFTYATIGVLIGMAVEPVGRFANHGPAAAPQTWNKISRAVVAAAMWVAVMTMSDIDITQSEDIIKAKFREQLLRFDKIQQKGSHPLMIDTATDYINKLYKALIK